MLFYGEIGRALVFVGQDGAITENAFAEVARAHALKLIPFSASEESDFMQAGLQYTHKVFPENWEVAKKALDGDFYFINDDTFQIKQKKDYGRNGFFIVYKESGEALEEAQYRVPFSYQFNLSANSYTWGTSPFSNIVNISKSPIVAPITTNDSELYLESVSTTGFTIVDRNIGQPVQADVIVWSNDYNSLDKWYIENQFAGTFTFGIPPLENLPIFTKKPFVMAIPTNDSSVYVDNLGLTGFTVVDRNIGQPAKFNLLILKDGLVRNRYIFHDLAPGTYTFGSGILSKVITYSRPIILKQDMADGQTYLDNVTDTGFDIVSRGIGSSYKVSIAIITF